MLIAPSGWEHYRAGAVSNGTKVKFGTRTHVAAVSSGTSVALYVDGRPAPVDVKKTDPFPFFPRTIGCSAIFDASDRKWFFGGVLEQVRISTSGRYSAPFVPAPRFEPDADTMLLYRCDEGKGNVLKDASGNGRDGKIVDARWVRSHRNEAAVHAPAPEYALELDGTRSCVVMPQLPYDGRSPMTFEAWATPTQKLRPNGPGGRVRFSGQPAPWGLQIAPLRLAAHRLGPASNGPAVKFGKRTHVAAVWDGATVSHFLDGNADSQ